MKIANEILIPELARLLREGKEVRFTPSGVSMRPFIEGDKDSVILAPVLCMPGRGDILLAQITFGDNTTYVLHRLVRVEREKYILQGDGNLAGEETCGREDIIGRVLVIEDPKGRRKRLTKGQVWYKLMPIRRYLLKIYRHTWLKWYYK